MLVIFAVTCSVIFIIRAYFTNKHVYNMHSCYLKTEIHEYNDLYEKLKKLSPEQMDKLISDGEEFFNLKKTEKSDLT